MKKLVLLLALPLFAQAPVATFTQFSPTVIGMTIGASHCYAWSQLPVPWPVIVACYSGTATEQIQAQAIGQSMVGNFNDADGYFTWIVTPNGAMNYWQMTAQPVGGTAIYQQGSF